MRTVLTALGFIGLLAGAIETGLAQSVEDQTPLSAQATGPGLLIFVAPTRTNLQSRAELEHWVREFSKWMEWRDDWLGTREIGWFSVRDRKQKPDPPDWLFEECEDSWHEDADLAKACQLLSAWKDDLATWRLKQAISKEREQREAPSKTAWWQHVHLDALWPMTEWRSSVYGIVGMHATMQVAGRFQVFIAPGVMLLNVPGPDGHREWKPSTDWGFAFRLFDFNLPLSDRPASLHVNIAKAWLFSNAGNLPFSSSIDLAGFSITFKQLK